MPAEDQIKVPYNRNSFGRLWKRNISAYRQYRFNHSFVSEFDRRNLYLKGLLHAKGLFEIKQPFYCRYGSHIFIGRNFTCGHDAFMEDEAKICIGDHVQIGNHCKLLTVQIMKDPVMRKKHKETCAPIMIGDHVYIGHDVTIMPGVTIGSCAIIADGSIVQDDVPEGTVMSGIPARIMQEESELIGPFDRQSLKEEDVSSTIIDRLSDAVNLEQVERIVHTAMVGIGLVAVYQATKQVIILKTELEEKKAAVEKYLPVLEKLPEIKECKKKFKR